MTEKESCVGVLDLGSSLIKIPLLHLNPPPSLEKQNSVMTWRELVGEEN